MEGENSCIYPEPLVSVFTFMERKAGQGSDNVCVRTCHLWDLGVSGNRIFEMPWKILR